MPIISKLSFFIIRQPSFVGRNSSCVFFSHGQSSKWFKHDFNNKLLPVTASRTSDTVLQPVLRRDLTEEWPDGHGQCLQVGSLVPLATVWMLHFLGLKCAPNLTKSINVQRKQQQTVKADWFLVENPCRFSGEPPLSGWGCALGRNHPLVLTVNKVQVHRSGGRGGERERVKEKGRVQLFWNSSGTRCLHRETFHEKKN